MMGVKSVEHIGVEPMTSSPNAFGAASALFSLATNQPLNVLPAFLLLNEIFKFHRLYSTFELSAKLKDPIM